MGTEHLPLNEPGRSGEPSLWGDDSNDMHSLLEENALQGDEPSLGSDEYSGDMHSLLEENARLRGLLIKLSDLVLKNVVHPR